MRSGDTALQGEGTANVMIGGNQADGLRGQKPSPELHGRNIIYTSLGAQRLKAKVGNDEFLMMREHPYSGRLGSRKQCGGHVSRNMESSGGRLSHKMVWIVQSHILFLKNNLHYSRMI